MISENDIVSTEPNGRQKCTKKHMKDECKTSE